MITNPSSRVPTVLALDFDGVLCNGIKEYFQTAWRVCRVIWPSVSATPPTALAEAFYRLRPVVETGWEMPILVRAIEVGTDETEILHEWLPIAHRILQRDDLTPAQLGAAVDNTRDRWIAKAADSWLAEQDFYPGVVERLQAVLNSATEVVIISTKEGRFIRQLLQQRGVPLDHLQIFGKESKRPKSQVLREIIAEREANQEANPVIWFVEDRLKTLHTIQEQPDLSQVELFLADWGYNTATDRANTHSTKIHLLSLQQFNQDFSNWIATDTQ